MDNNNEAQEPLKTPDSQEGADDSSTDSYDDDYQPYEPDDNQEGASTEGQSLEEIQKKLDKVISDNRKLYSRAKKAEEKAKESFNNQADDSQKSDMNKAPAEAKSLTEDELGTVLSLREQGYSEGEILKLRTYSKKMNTPIAEVSKDPFIKAGLEAERAKKSEQETTPAPSSAAFTVENKTWDTMSKKERRANNKAYIDSLLRKSKGGSNQSI